MYDPAKVVLPPDFAARPTAPKGFPPVSVRQNTDLFIGREATPEQAREMTRAYWASLSWMDHNVGRVLAELDRLELREKTVIVFWGDHGYHLGEKGRWSKAGSLFEVGTRVPLLIVAPGGKGNGKSCPRVVESLDLYRTLADLCGLSVADGVRGRSLVPLLDDPLTKSDRPAYSVWAERDQINGVAVRTAKYRYAEWDGEKGGPMLFDVDADPHELKNLADDSAYADVRKELAALLRDFRKKK
jgi:arylsulfatase A-like enzyme